MKQHYNRALLIIILFLLWFHPMIIQAGPLPFVKQWTETGLSVELGAVSIQADTGTLQNEIEILRQSLIERRIECDSGAFPILLELSPLTLPMRSSDYQQELTRQSYRLQITKEGIRIQSPGAAGVFYGIQTLLQLLDNENRAPGVHILDWPDLPLRMVMVDPARQNENEGYYKRLVRFCARYKINVLHVHLTDDQTSCLYHEDYPTLMHPQAWKPERIQELLAFAQRYHIELIPEIESLGHSSMFKNHPDYRNILHQRDERDTDNWWWFPDVPGYNNVLCPASDQALEYLDKMYGRTARGFPHPQIHAGFDEVVPSHCSRCEKKFGEISYEDWFLKHLLNCRTMLNKRERKIALWGDILLKSPAILEGLPVEDTIIYDWHYNPDVSDESVKLFKEKGYEVIACPALICMPRMILPDEGNYTNIQEFARIAREQDLLGLDTTIWLPTRYMSDALWTGLAFAAVHSWAGSNWDEGLFYRDFAGNYFGSPEGPAFEKAWKDLSRMTWHNNKFNTGCWADEDALAKALKMTQEQGEEIQKNLEKLREIRAELSRIGKTVKEHHIEWKAIENSAAIRAYSMERLLASRNVRIENKWDTERIKELDRSCLEILEMIEFDWDRNRYADDPNKNGIHKTSQNLIHSFRKMHDFHQSILETPQTQSPHGSPE